MRILPILFLLLAGCNGSPPLPEVRIVKVPVPVGCVNRADLPIAPTIASNQALNALPDDDLVLTIASERLDLLRYSGEQSALLIACVR